MGPDFSTPTMMTALNAFSEPRGYPIRDDKRHE